MVAVNGNKLLDAEYHGRRFHRHSGVTVSNLTVTVLKRISGRLQRVVTGYMCLYCGYQPNDNARAMHQEVLEKILAKKSKARLARRSSK